MRSHFLRRLLLGAALLLSLNACGILEAEKSHPGGFVGKSADDMIFPADNKMLQVFRGMVVGTAFARIAERSVTEEADAIVVVARINGVRSTVSRLYELASSNCEFVETEKECARNAYTTTFEAKLPDLYDHLFRLAANGMPREQFKELMEEVGSGDLIGTVWAALNASKEIAAAAQSAFAVGRSATEARAIALSKADSIKDDAKRSEAIAALMKRNSVDGSIAFLNATMAAAQHDVRPSKTLFFALFSVMKESCGRIRSKIGDAVGDSYVCEPDFLGTKTSNDGLRFQH